MNLSDIIKAVGDENVKVEPVDANLVGNVKVRSNGRTLISLETDCMRPDHFVFGNPNIGLLIWIPRDKMQAVVKRETPEQFVEGTK